MDVETTYKNLLARHGQQGWWPLLTQDGQEFDDNGYHPGLYEAVSKQKQRYEVYLGSILTQNTQWSNAQQALNNLRTQIPLTPDAIQEINRDTLAEHITPARYCNTKSTYLKAITTFFQNKTHPTRQQLLNVNGVGPETADTILLYAHQEPRIIADTYTERWLRDHNITITGYDEIQAFLDNRFPRSYKERNELHALIVTDQKMRSSQP